MVAIRERRIPFADPKWTRRQQEVLELLGRGYTNPRIAEHLGISLDGAKWHVAEILDRLNVNSREDAAEYWRERNGIRTRLERRVSSFAPPLVARWFGPIAAGVGILAMVAFGAAVFATRGGADTELVAQVPSAAASVTTPAATQSGAGSALTPPPGTPNPPIPETIAGAPVYRFNINAPALPTSELVVYLARGCSNCDSPDATIDRAIVFQQDGKALARNDVLLPEDPRARLHNIWISPGGAEQWASVCQQGNCGDLGPITADARTRLYQSIDGGALWKHAADVEGVLRIVGRQGGTLIAERWPQGTGQFPTYETYPGGTPVQAPQGGQMVAAVTGTSLTWQAADGVRYLDDNGTSIVDASWDTQRLTNERTSLLSPGTGPLTLVQWRRANGEQFIGAAINGQLKATFIMPNAGFLVRLASWLPDGRGVGTVILPVRSIPGVTPPPGTASDAAIAIPALIDFERGEVTPLLLFGSLVNNGTLSAEYTGNRNRVLGASIPAATIYRVAAPDDCLYLRDRPSQTAVRKICMEDGAIVTAPGKEPVSAEGRQWIVVTTLAGEEGWASLDYLRRQ